MDIFIRKIDLECIYFCLVYKTKMNKRRFPKKESVKTENPFTITEEYRRKILDENAYIGQQGFTMKKNEMDPDDLREIKKILTVEPIASFSGPKTEVISFPVFRENEKKIYIPRFYGESRYGGNPAKMELSLGDAISVPFVKPIRDYQEKIIQVYLDHISRSESGPRSGGGILEVPCGRGKCLGINTPILMFDGSVKMVQDIVVGDILMGDDSTSRKVLTLARGKEQMYKIREKISVICDEEFIGESYIVNESHILSLHSLGTEQIIDLSVKDYLVLPKHLQETLYGYRVPILFPENSCNELYNPYYVGIRENSIPDIYKFNCKKIQQIVLAGMIDAYGIFHFPNYIEIHRPNKIWIEDFLFISRSLGLNIYRSVKDPFTLILKIDIHVLQLNIFKKEFLVFKKEYLQNEIENTLDYKFTVEKLGIDDYYGFEIDGNRRFVLGDFTVTHNTVMALKIISMVERKTLILVHKEFLMNQWIERIGEFMPTARVGKIQGPKFEIDEKDIVIGMIQSLYDRAFAPNAFTSFGLTIVDEVHRIASEEFSKTLFKTITNCMLGISATVDRKDGLTNVLHMFIGPKIYTEERKDEDVVEVRAIEYVNTDPEYNEVAYDYMGNVAHTTMISKISNFPPRCHFIVKILRDLIAENGEKQIMVLSQIRGLLTTIHEQLVGYEFDDVGFYVGGMKQKDLQATEEKQIVLATYAMAAEALDIKTLNTLVMVSPKTDIIQSVGRILRTRGAGKIIVDIIDTHDVFQNQWKKRRVYYKKCGYGISYVKSPDYVNMEIKDSWKRVANASKMEEEDMKPKCFIDVSEIDFERKIA